MTFAQRFPFYLTPATSAALLQRSRELRAQVLARRELRALLKRHGFGKTAAGELVDINEKLMQRPLR